MFLLAALTARAQQTTGTLGSPSATTTIDGKQLPAPAPKFGGVIKESAKDSTPWWPPRIVPPKGAPNVLLIMTDDPAVHFSRIGVTLTLVRDLPHSKQHGFNRDVINPQDGHIVCDPYPASRGFGLCILWSSRIVKSTIKSKTYKC
jgi:hypothetical protein